jgi:acetyl esterase/lipase
MTRLGRPVGAAMAVLATLALVWISASGSVAAAASGPTTPATPYPPDQIVVLREIAFTKVGGVTLTLDVYRPPQPVGLRPAVVVVHGGAWGSGSAGDVESQARLFAREGWVAFAINYRLTSQTPNPWPDELSDVQRAVRWVGAHARSYDADPDKLSMLGVSAGGHLAILVAELGTAVDGTGRKLNDPNPPVTVRAVAAWSPPTRLAGLVTPPDGDTPPDCGNRNDNCAHFWRLPLVQKFLGCLPTTCPARYAAASPTSRATAFASPIWWSNARQEITPLPQAQALDRSLQSAGVDHQLDVVAGDRHADEDQTKVWNDMVPWMAAKLGVATPPPISFSGRSILLSPLVVVSVVIGLALLIVLLAVAIRDHEGEL